MSGSTCARSSAEREPRWVVKKSTKPKAKARAKPAVAKAKPAVAKANPAAAPPGKAPSINPVLAAEQLERVRAVCLSLPGTSERSSHGAPSFFVDDKRAFAHFCDNHHYDGRLALWCAAPDGAQAMLIDASPDHYFLPPYVGGAGWIGVRLDRGLAWSEVAAVLEHAHATRAVPPRQSRRDGKRVRSIGRTP